MWQVFWDRHGHLSWLCQIICLKDLYWPVIFSTKTCPNPKSRLKFSVPSPTVVSVVSLSHQKTYPVYLFCEKKLVSSLSSSLTHPIPWHLDPSANFSFCILTRLQTHPLASWPVCKLFLWHLAWIVCEIFFWHLAILHRFSGVWQFQFNCNILRNFFASKSWILQRLISIQRCIPL